jgi:hypothetical protein
MLSKKLSQELADSAATARELNLNRVADNLEVAAEKFPEVFSYDNEKSNLARAYVRSSATGALYETPNGLETLLKHGEIEMTSEVKRLQLTLINLQEDVNFD